MTHPPHLGVDLLGDHLDGLLPPAAAREAAEHLAGCDACAARLRALRELLARAAAAPASIEPPRDLWPLVRARIAPASRGAAPPPRAGRRWWGGGASLAAAAAALLALGVGSAGLRDRAGAANVAAPRTAPPPIADHARLDAEYATAAAQLAAAVESGRGALAPATAAAVEQSLGAIDGAIDEARAALARDPHNPALVEMLSASYGQKLALLKRAADLPSRL
jgi:anti-sigma factor RsiW